MTMIDNLNGMLERGVDGALLRYSLGHELLKNGDLAAAIAHLREALRLDETYSAAWKGLGRALAATGEHAEAVDVLERGIAVAKQRGDVQAAKEMGVFLKRSQQQLATA
jgi:Tfp pilus assembly protein PilF